MGVGTRFTVAADLDGTIVYWSKEAEEALGWEEADAVGLHFVRRIFPRTLLVRGYAAFTDAFRGHRWEGEVHCRRPDGSEVCCLLEVAPIHDDEGIVSGVLVSGQVVAPEPISFEGVDLKKEFLVYLSQERNLSFNTGTAYITSINRIERFTGKSFVDLAYDVPAVRTFLREAEFASATKAQALAALKSVLKFMHLEGYIGYSPIQEIASPKKTRHVKRALSLPSVHKLLAACKRPVEYRLIYLGLYAGTRVSESARVGADDWVEDRIHILGKGRKWREVPVHPELVRVRDVILSKAYSDQTLKHVATAMSETLSIDFSSHDLRHTFSRTLRDMRVDRFILGALLGHAPSTTEIYAEVTFPEMQEALFKLNYGTMLKLVEGDQ